MSDSAMQRGGASAPLGTSEDLDLSEVRDWFALL
jgi:protoheme IX farnesyltransferase